MRQAACALFCAALVSACAAQNPVAAAPAPRGAEASSPLPAALPADAGASLDPAEAPAGLYRLDPRHASVIWRVRHTGLGIFVGRFDRAEGELHFDPQHPEASTLRVSIAANSASTSVAAPDGTHSFDREVAGYLGAERAPDIQFTSARITRTGPTTGLIEGDLSFNGQTHPAMFETQFQGGRFIQLRGRHVLAFSARTVLQRSQWDVGGLALGPFVGDAVEVLVEAEFVRE